MRFAPFALLTAALAAPSFALAQNPRQIEPTMLGSAWFDVGAFALGGAMVGAGLALSPPQVDAAPLDGLGARPWRPAVATVTDVTLWGGMTATLLVGLAVDRYGNGTRGLRLLRAPIVLAESAWLAIGVVSVVKNLGGVCRPRAWNDATQTCTHDADEDRRAFPSGHTAPLAAMAGASLGMMLFDDVRPLRWPLLATATALAGANLVLRVVAGAHSWVDTGTGFAIGASIGLLTAAGHSARSPVTLGASAQGVTVSGVF